MAINLHNKLPISIIKFIDEFGSLQSDLLEEIKYIKKHGLNKSICINCYLLKVKQICLTFNKNFFYNNKKLVIKTPTLHHVIELYFQLGSLDNNKLTIKIGINKLEHQLNSNVSANDTSANDTSAKFNKFAHLETKERVKFLSFMLKLEHEIYIKLIKDEELGKYLLTYRYFPIIITKDIYDSDDNNIIGHYYNINMSLNNQTQYYLQQKDGKIISTLKNNLNLRQNRNCQFIFEPFISLNHDIKLISVKLLVKAIMWSS